MSHQKTVEIVIPQVGEAVADVRLIQWFKEEGDQVNVGDILFEVDTDKATLEVEAFDSGVLEKILVGPDSEVQPLDVVGILKLS